MCACKWARHPRFGDIVIEQCADHAAQTERGIAADRAAAEERARREMDLEVDRVIERRRS